MIAKHGEPKKIKWLIAPAAVAMLIFGPSFYSYAVGDASPVDGQQAAPVPTTPVSPTPAPAMQAAPLPNPNTVLAPASPTPVPQNCPSPKASPKYTNYGTGDFTIDVNNDGTADSYVQTDPDGDKVIAFNDPDDPRINLGSADWVWLSTSPTTDVYAGAQPVEVVTGLAVHIPNPQGLPSPAPQPSPAASPNPNGWPNFDDPMPDPPKPNVFFTVTYVDSTAANGNPIKVLVITGASVDLNGDGTADWTVPADQLDAFLAANGLTNLLGSSLKDDLVTLVPKTNPSPSPSSRPSP